MRCELSIASLTPLSLLVGLISTVQADDQKPPLSPRLAAPLVVEAFPLPQIRLLDGPFRQAQERDKAYLLSLDVDRLLHTFRLNAGLPTDAQPLGGWEEPDGELRGHFAGHYLTACSLMYAATGDARFKTRVDELVAGLAACQQALGSSGYLSAYPETFIDRVEAGRPFGRPITPSTRSTPACLTSTLRPATHRPLKSPATSATGSSNAMDGSPTPRSRPCSPTSTAA